MRLRSSIWSGSVLKAQESFDSMNVADESQWDEAVCTLSGCQHPQCWASLRRIERGHPRILDPSPKSPRETEDKLPTLTIVNITDTCLWTQKRVAQQQPSEFTFPKDRPSLSKPASKRQSRSPKALRDKDVTSRSPRPLKLSVLNLNEAKLPLSENVSNMVVTWVPEETEKDVSPVQKTDVSSWPGKKRRKKLRKKSKPSLYYPGRQYSRSPAAIVPPPSPEHHLEQLSPEAIPLWAQVGMLPQDLLEECILAHEKSIIGPEVKIELSKMRKSLPLERRRPESAISSKMYLTIQRLTLQRPSLRYPARLRKLCPNLKQGEGLAGHGSSDSLMQQGKAKTFPPKQEPKKKAKRNVKGQYGEETTSGHFFHDSVGLRISGQEDQQTPWEEEDIEKTSAETHVSLEEVYEFDKYYTEYYATPESAVLYETVYQNLDDDEETMVGIKASSKDRNLKNLSAMMDGIGWNPELKLLRILQATEEEDEEGHNSRAQRA
ncbi:uncharacterized protein C9orf43 homolog isoform X2 [Mus musculus]|uniref:uncharacterized protein C9orf43 homolog isoform X2 n=1 Tax=Mus musculus TaxID=10090 RepID=UPI0003D7585F|nr:uncharacterized protein C9orf43 homolog isoform X2 [Mus musculus]|eukprot:XP_011248273.1 PREDICTED: uncharacterized protein C9orf43 homolog isoform X2 [Mus musculus]